MLLKSEGIYPYSPGINIALKLGLGQASRHRCAARGIVLILEHHAKSNIELPVDLFEQMVLRPFHAALTGLKNSLCNMRKLMFPPSLPRQTRREILACPVKCNIWDIKPELVAKLKAAIVRHKFQKGPRGNRGWYGNRGSRGGRQQYNRPWRTQRGFRRRRFGGRRFAYNKKRTDDKKATAK